jgi:hypothetical protein
MVTLAYDDNLLRTSQVFALYLADATQVARLLVEPKGRKLIVPLARD